MPLDRKRRGAIFEPQSGVSAVERSAGFAHIVPGEGHDCAVDTRGVQMLCLGAMAGAMAAMGFLLTVTITVEFPRSDSNSYANRCQPAFDWVGFEYLGNSPRVRFRVQYKLSV